VNTPNILNANDLKVGGVTAIETALHSAPEAVISVRGDRRYVVMRAAQYDYLRECELEAAWLATQADRASTTSGRAKTMTAAEHITDMQHRLQTTSATTASRTVQQTRATYEVNEAKANVGVKVKAKAAPRIRKKVV
jgi:hypothetical protein